VDLRQFLSTLRSRWKFIAAVFALALVAAFVITSLMSPTYASNARMYVQLTKTSTPADQFYVSQRMSSYAEFAKDTSLLERVIADTGADITPDQLAGQISTTVTTGSVVLGIEVRAKSPGVAQDLAGAVAQELADLVTDLETPAPVKGDPDKDTTPTLVAKVPSEPSFNGNPVSPKLALNLSVAGILGLLIGVAGALVREMFDSALHSTAAITDVTGAPALAEIPFDRTVDESPLISDPNAPPSRGEPYRVLRTNLQFVDIDSKQHVFVVTSSVPGEGKTVTVTNLAVAMAQAGRDVLLIDCDLRRPRVAELLGLSNEVGVMNVAAGTATLPEAIQRHHTGLDFLAAGPPPPNPSEILSTDTMRAILGQARDSYDLVLIDAPPLLPVTDPAILAGFVGGALLVVEQDNTTRDLVKQSVARLDAVGARIYGVIPTKAPLNDTASHYLETYLARTPSRKAGREGVPGRRAKDR